MKVLSLVCVCLYLFACSQPAEPPAPRSAAMPAGFGDEAPPPPTSDTIILSGGMLLTEPPIADSVVVITDGVVMGWGQRGSQHVPNDSIGKDMRGKWLLPISPLSSGQAANLEIYDQAPNNADDGTAIGYVRGNELNLPVE